MALKTSDGIHESVAIEFVRICPVSDAIDRINDYQRQVSKVVGKIYPWDGSEEFEKTILDRKDKSLDLLIARAICDYDNAKVLWERAESESVNGDAGYAHALKYQLMSGPVAFELISENAFSIHDPTNVFRQVFGALEEWNDLAEAALSNPKARDLIEAYVDEKSLFAHQSEVFKLCAWRAISQNPCINEERDYSDSPDMTAWNIRGGIEKLFLEAPATDNWFYVLDALLTELNPKIYSAHKFDFDSFIEKWNSAATNNESDDKRSEFDPSYPMLVARFIAKFGGEYKPAKPSHSIDAANKSEDLFAKASFFGNANLRRQEVLEALEESTIFWPEIEFLLENRSIYYNPEFSEKVRRYVAEIDNADLLKRFEKNVSFHTSPRLISPSAGGSQVIPKEDQLVMIQEINARIKAIDGTREALERRLVNFENSLKSTAKTVIFWAAIAALVIYFK